MLEITGVDTAVTVGSMDAVVELTKDVLTVCHRSIYTDPAEQAIDDYEGTTFNNSNDTNSARSSNSTKKCNQPPFEGA